MAKSQSVRGPVVSPVSGARATVTSRAVEETIGALQHAVREQGHALAKAAPWWGRLFRIANAIPDEQAAA